MSENILIQDRGQQKSSPSHSYRRYPALLPYKEAKGIKDMRPPNQEAPNNLFELCNNCYWCCTCINMKGAFEICPLCRFKVSNIPLVLDF